MQEANHLKIVAVIMSIVFIIVVLVTLVLLKRLIIAVAVIKVLQTPHPPSKFANSKFSFERPHQSLFFFETRIHCITTKFFNCVVFGCLFKTGSCEGDRGNTKPYFVPHCALPVSKCVFDLLGSSVTLPLQCRQRDSKQLQQQLCGV